MRDILGNRRSRRSVRGWQVSGAMAAIFVLALGLATATTLLSAEAARGKAIRILEGDPYGNTDAEVQAHIKEARLVRSRDVNIYDIPDKRVWEFHIVVVTADKDNFQDGVIDGYLELDASNGELLCTNLPLLD